MSDDKLTKKRAQRFGDTDTDFAIVSEPPEDPDDDNVGDNDDD